MSKIFFVSPLIAQYRVTFFEKLYAANPDVLVLYRGKLKDDGRPEFKGNVDFDRLEYNSHISFTNLVHILKAFRLYRPHSIVLEGASGTLIYWFFILLAKIFKVKIIYWVCGWQPKRSYLFASFKRLINKVYYSFGDKFVCYSTDAKKYLRQLNITNEIVIAFNGIETDNYDPVVGVCEDIATNNQVDFNAHSPLKFLYVGGIFNGKNVFNLIKSFEIVSLKKPSLKLQLDIVGDGPLYKQLKAYVNENRNSNIILHGRVESGVERFFVEADVFVLPGVGGLALNQAMLWGTPCICGEADGTENDLVLDGLTGIRFDPLSKNGLEKALERVVNSLTKSDLNRMGALSQRFILERSSVNNMVVTFTKLFSSYR